MCKDVQRRYASQKLETSFFTLLGCYTFLNPDGSKTCEDNSTVYYNKTCIDTLELCSQFIDEVLTSNLTHCESVNENGSIIITELDKVANRTSASEDYFK